jgi:hypothetical protein
MIKYFIKVDADKNPITNPENENSLKFALGEDFNKDGNYIEYIDPPIPDLVEVTYPVNREYVLITDEATGKQHFEPKRVERQFSQAEKIYVFIVMRRDQELKMTDWLVLPGSPIDETERQAWYTYRQALRDLPAKYPNISSADEVVWPEMPNPTRLGIPRPADPTTPTPA